MTTHLLWTNDPYTTYTIEVSELGFKVLQYSLDGFGLVEDVVAITDYLRSLNLAIIEAYDHAVNSNLTVLESEVVDRY